MPNVALGVGFDVTALEFTTDPNWGDVYVLSDTGDRTPIEWNPLNTLRDVGWWLAYRPGPLLYRSAGSRANRIDGGEYAYLDYDGTWSAGPVNQIPLLTKFRGILAHMAHDGDVLHGSPYARRA